MSARDDLILLLETGLPDDVLSLEDVADEVLNQHALELAEVQRKHADTMTNREWATGTLIGADLIDPQIKK